MRDGRFVLLGALGQGSQGCTFDGVDKREGQAVAIKRFDVRGARTWKDAELAEREARVLQALAHPKLPKYIDHFEEDGALYLVMEKIEGESLASLRRRGVVFGERQVVRLLRDASDILGYLHDRAAPVIHRDLKPGNVLMRPDGTFAFVDFGAVRDKLRPEGGSTIVGTFGYMAPEQFQGRALPASDVYAVGATALAMLTGREPETLPHKGLAIDVRASFGRNARRPLVDALERMLDPDPDRRASEIAPLVTALERRLNRSAGDAGSASRPRRGRSASDVAGSGHEAGRGAGRRARRAARSAERAARRSLGRRRGLPWPIALLFTLAFAAGIVAISVVMQVIVPVALFLLSSFVAPRTLRAAAARARDAGRRSVEAMERSRRWLWSTRTGDGWTAHAESTPPIEGDRYVRVAFDGDDRVRVEEDGEELEDDTSRRHDGAAKR